MWFYELVGGEGCAGGVEGLDESIEGNDGRGAKCLGRSML